MADFAPDEQTPMCALGTRLMRYRFSEIPEYAEFKIPDLNVANIEGDPTFQKLQDSFLNACCKETGDVVFVPSDTWIQLTELVRCCECGTFVTENEDCDC